MNLFAGGRGRQLNLIGGKIETEWRKFVGEEGFEWRLIEGGECCEKRSSVGT